MAVREDIREDVQRLADDTLDEIVLRPEVGEEVLNDAGGGVSGTDSRLHDGLEDGQERRPRNQHGVGGGLIVYGRWLIA